MTYKAIGFDWGGVINGKPGKYFSIGIAEILGTREQAFKDAYFSHNKAFNRGDINLDELWNRVLGDLGKVDKTDEVMAFLRETHKISVNHNVMNLVDTLKLNGYKVGLLSNNTTEGGNEIRALGLDKHFDVFHISADTGDVKPEPSSFTNFAAALGIEPTELIFIDDTPKSLETSVSVGFAPILYESYDQCINDLESLGINVS